MPSSKTCRIQKKRAERPRSGKKRTKIPVTSSSSDIYRKLVFPPGRIIPTCIVSPTPRLEPQAPVIIPEVVNPQIVVIDLDTEEALQQRRRAFLEENRRDQEIEIPAIPEIPILEISDSEMSD